MISLDAKKAGKIELEKKEKDIAEIKGIFEAEIARLKQNQDEKVSNSLSFDGDPPILLPFFPFAIFTQERCL